MKLNRFLTIVVGCLFVAVSVFGQTANLTGKVTSGGAALPGVTVTVSSATLASPRTAVTDANGNYSFSLPPGEYAVTFDLSGMGTITKHATITAGEFQTVDASMQAGTSGVREELTVTGSLIPRPTLEAMAPVATLDVQEIQYQGTTRLEDFLTNLPQVFAAQSSVFSNGASGTATIDLRGLGARRTLVLIDGKRMPPGDAGAISPDLNFIPSGLVKRVDILTGGASTVYGADAVSGVVNFIMDTDFEGLKAGVSGGIYNHNNNNSIAQSINKARGFAYPTGSAWDGQQVEGYAALGGKFGDSGHAMLYVDYRNTRAVLKSQRDYTACSVTGLSESGPSCTGSSSIPNGRFAVFNATTGNLGPSWTLDTSNSAGNVLRRRVGTDLFNFGPYNYMQRPDKRWAAGAILNYDLNKHAQPYASVMLMDDNTDAQIAPSGAFFGGTVFEVNCDNPMLSANEVANLCTAQGYGPKDRAQMFIGKRSVEGKGRVDLLTHEAYRALGGIKGDIGRGWSYDVSGLRGETRVPEQYDWDMSTTKIQNALLVTGDPNNPSTWHCIDPAAVAAGCVPWNIFKLGGVTQAAVDYLRFPTVSTTLLRLEQASATLNGDLKQWGLAFPSAVQGLSLAVGASYQTNLLDYRPDFATATGERAGAGGPSPAVAGSYRVKDLYGELLVPIIQGARFAKDLSLNLGYRTSDYSTSGRFPSYKAQFSYSPMDLLKFRGGYNRAVRSPNIVELFSPQSIGLGGSADICAGEKPAATLQQCVNTGVKPSQYGNILENPADQYNTLGGGNPKLSPEIANTRTFGVVITPGTLAIALDYYDIKMKDTIGSLGANQVIAQCAATGDPTLCALIHRDPATGTLWTGTGYTITTNQNIGQLRAQGIDVNIDYTRPISRGALTLSLIGTHIMKAVTATPLYRYDCTSFYGDTCGIPTARWRHLARAAFQVGPASVALGWRYIGGTTIDAVSSASALSQPDLLAAYRAVGSYQLATYNFMDLSATYNIARNVHWTLGVNNIADKQPPLGAGVSTVDFQPGLGFYDPYGRYVHTSLVLNF
jgi:outer membrane receptor protein involved in Fe transport